MQVLKEICDKDPINATYVTTYTRMLHESYKNSDFTDPGQEGATEGAAVEGGAVPRSTEAITEARKVFESSLRYNASQVDIWYSYLLFL